MSRVRVERPGSFVIGAVFVTVSVVITVNTYRPLPPGTGPADGRGLFAPLVIVPLAALGGVAVGRAVEPAAPSAVETLVAALVATAVSITPSVGYMLLFAGPSVAADPSVYVDWYTVGLAAAAGLASARVIIWNLVEYA